MIRTLLASLLLLVGGCVTPVTTASAPRDALMEEVVGDLCRRDVALLGEASHGDGRALAFKAALVPRLIEQCGFDAVFFEGSSYDFLELERRRGRGEQVSRAMLSSAIGGLWNRYAEMQPLIAFLHERSASGQVRLGGLDDQLGSAGAFYSIAAMPAELSALLPGDREAECRETFRSMIYGKTGASAAERAPLQSCVAEIRAAILGRPESAGRPERMHLLDNIERYAGRDRSDVAAMLRGRDRSMWLNFQWLRERLPRGSKIIVWGATAHLSRNATAHKPFSGGGNLGSYVDKAYGKRAFFLGFTAAGGSHRWGWNAIRPLTPAQPGSLEMEALRAVAGDSVYLGRSELKRLGERSASVFGDDPSVANWARVLDGVVVFREERAPDLAPPDG